MTVGALSASVGSLQSEGAGFVLYPSTPPWQPFLSPQVAAGSGVYIFTVSTQLNGNRNSDTGRGLRVIRTTSADVLIDIVGETEGGGAGPAQWLPALTVGGIVFMNAGEKLRCQLSLDASESWDGSIFRMVQVL